MSNPNQGGLSKTPVKCRLDTILSRAVHRPIINKKGIDLPPLYARVGLETDTTFDAEGIKDPLWRAQSEIHYNSPTNIRRLFIGDKYVFIQYYQPPISNGKSSGKYWARYSIESDEPLNILSFIRFNQLSGRVLPYNGKVLDVDIKQTGLSVLSKYWKVSNIEELFFTPSLLMSQDIINTIPEAPNIYKMFYRMDNGQPVPGSIQRNDLPLKLFLMSNCRDIKDLRGRFPRLRTVAIMSNIDTALERPNRQSLHEGIPSSVADLNTQWIEAMKDKGLMEDTSILFSQIKSDKDSSLNFTIRNGIYKFDQRVLSVYAAEYRTKAENLAREQRDAKLGINNSPTKKSQYEEYLDSMCEADGEEIVQSSIMMMFATYSTEQIDKVFNEMSPEGRKKYRGLLGR